MSSFFADLSMVSLIESTLRVSVPLVFAALGGMICERTGVINIALEGLMLVGALAAAVITVQSGVPELGWIASGGAGVLLAGLYGLCVIEFRANQIVAGTAINLFALGVTPFLTKILYGSTGATPKLELVDRLVWMPYVVAIVVIVGVTVWFHRLRSGLWVRFCGENPQALASQGISVRRTRWGAVLVSGLLAGFGGACLSIWIASGFTRNMSAGRGFIALAALIFGKWAPIPTVLACLFFGLTEALQIRLQGVVLWGEQPVPVQFIQILPYVVTLAVLAGFVGRARAPGAIGLPFDAR